MGLRTVVAVQQGGLVFRVLKNLNERNTVIFLYLFLLNRVPCKMADYPNAEKIQKLKDLANKLRILSIQMTNASKSGYVYIVIVIRVIFV